MASRPAIALLGFALAATGAVRPAAAGVRRFAVLAAHRDGGAGTETLRWAARDARKLRDVLEELGGVEPSDVTLLLEPQADALVAALDRTEARVRAAVARGERTQLLLYYSGHAAAGELRLGRSRLPLERVKRFLERSRADIRVAFLDACQSGAITRLKGGRRAPSFVVDVEPTETSRGYVILTSSSEDEASQESEDLRGSFFTHYLVSGLRGAADREGDAQVTLGELYQYTYSRTVAHTTGTRGGTQHPAYSYELQGNGAVVLTRLAGLGALVFPDGAEGTYLVYDVGRDRIVGEVEKAAGERRRLSVPAGRYAVKKRASDHLLLQRVEVGASGERVVAEGRFRAVAFEDDITKGPGWLRQVRTLRPRVAVRAHVGYESFFDRPTRDTLFHPSGLVGLRLDAANLVAPAVSVHADLAVGQTDGEVRGGPWDQSLPLDFLFVTAGLGLSWDWWLGDARLQVGPRLSALYLRRDFQDAAIPFQDLFTLCPGAEAGLAWWLSHWVIGGHVRASYLRYATEAEDRSLGFAEAFVSLGYAP